MINDKMLFLNQLNIVIYFFVLCNLRKSYSKPIQTANRVNDDELSLVLGGLSLSDLKTLNNLIDGSYSLAEDEDTLNVPFYEFDEDLSFFMDDLRRVKRENSLVQQQRQMVDEEYLKLLENSFPHDDEQPDHDYNDGRKEHIRVKRD